jgi:hypothetical protein
LSMGLMATGRDVLGRVSMGRDVRESIILVCFLCQ